MEPVHSKALDISVETWSNPVLSTSLMQFREPITLLYCLKTVRNPFSQCRLRSLFRERALKRTTSHCRCQGHGFRVHRERFRWTKVRGISSPDDWNLLISKTCMPMSLNPVVRSLGLLVGLKPMRMVHLVSVRYWRANMSSSWTVIKTGSMNIVLKQSL